MCGSTSAVRGPRWKRACAASSPLFPNGSYRLDFMNRRTVLTLLGSSLPFPTVAAPAPDPAPRALRSCRQLLKVVSSGWKATAGTLTLWTRESPRDPWRASGPPIPVALGRNGMRWGHGLHAVPAGAAVKREGDL